MLRRPISWIVIVTFVFSLIGPYKSSHAADAALGFPVPGSMINLSPAYQPVIIKGLTVHKDNPFLFDFIVDVGQDKMSGEPLKQEGEKLIKYFLASLAIPDKDVWVNLSPYEKNKMIPEALSQTDMGRDLLEQDYILKQITASLIYPEKQLGKTFWNTVYAKAQAEYGTTDIPIGTFNKVWIMADRASVYEHNQTAFVVDQHLKVMLEEDYLALQKHSESMLSLDSRFPTKTFGNDNAKAHSIASSIVRQIVLPELEKEVNTGKNFANLRQIFNSIILSSWYKKNLQQALLNQVYANKSKVKGIDLNDPTIKQQIYDQYLKAYKKGVFNYIKEDINKANGETIPRKYFSGGINEAMAANPQVTTDAALVSNSLQEVSDRLVDFATLASFAVVVPDRFSNKVTSKNDYSFTRDTRINTEFNLATKVDLLAVGTIISGLATDPKKIFNHFYTHTTPDDYEALVEPASLYLFGRDLGMAEFKKRVMALERPSIATWLYDRKPSNQYIQAVFGLRVFQTIEEVSEQKHGSFAMRDLILHLWHKIGVLSNGNESLQGQEGLFLARALNAINRSKRIRIFTKITFSDFAMATDMPYRTDYVNTVYQIGATDRSGQEGKTTLRVFEIFNLDLTSSEQAHVLAEINDHPDKHILLLKPETMELAKNGSVKIVLTADMGVIPADFIDKEITLGDNAPAVLPGAISQDPTSIPTTSQVRLSPAGLYRIRINGMYLLSFNKNRLKKGKFSVTPIGGAFDFLNQEGKAQYEQAGIVMKNDDDNKPLEMRQTIAGDKVADFLRLFNRGIGREVSAVRELEEELVGNGSEEDVFQELPQNSRLMYHFVGRFLNPQEVFDAIKSEIEKKIAVTGASFPMDKLERAYALAVQLYTAKRDDGRVYAMHPLEIAYYLVHSLGITDPDTILAAILHDLAEDTSFNIDDIRREFGDGVAVIVQDLTEKGDLREQLGRLYVKAEHLKRVEDNGRAASITIKVVDRLHNLLTNELPQNTHQRRMEIPEIDLWEKFLSNPVIPQTAKNEIMPFLGREREIIFFSAAMMAKYLPGTAVDYIEDTPGLNLIQGRASYFNYRTVVLAIHKGFNESNEGYFLTYLNQRSGTDRSIEHPVGSVIYLGSDEKQIFAFVTRLNQEIVVNRTHSRSDVDSKGYRANVDWIKGEIRAFVLKQLTEYQAPQVDETTRIRSAHLYLSFLGFSSHGPDEKIVFTANDFNMYSKDYGVGGEKELLSSLKMLEDTGLAQKINEREWIFNRTIDPGLVRKYLGLDAAMVSYKRAFDRYFKQMDGLNLRELQIFFFNIKNTGDDDPIKKKFILFRDIIAYQSGLTSDTDTTLYAGYIRARMKEAWGFIKKNENYRIEKAGNEFHALKDDQGHLIKGETFSAELLFKILDSNFNIKRTMLLHLQAAAKQILESHRDFKVIGIIEKKRQDFIRKSAEDFIKGYVDQNDMVRQIAGAFMQIAIRENQGALPKMVTTKTMMNQAKKAIQEGISQWLSQSIDSEYAKDYFKLTTDNRWSSSVDFVYSAPSIRYILRKGIVTIRGRLGNAVIINIKQEEAIATTAGPADTTGQHPDAAMNVDLKGGIDLNTSNGMRWKISKDGRGVEMNIDPAMIARVRREGISSLSPFILSITPITSVWPLAGIQAPVK